MAITLDGTLNTYAGATTGSYIRIDFVKVMPWIGQIEYNPMIFKNTLEADMSRIKYYGDELPTSTFPIPTISMSFESGSFSEDFELADLQTFPITGALTEVVVDHYGTALMSSSIEVTDFDDDGNEVTTSEILKWTEYSIVSQSTENKYPIDLSKTSSIIEQCYVHLRGVIAEQIPSQSILDI